MRAKPVHVTDSNTKEMVNKNSLTLIDCWAPWCSRYVVITSIFENGEEVNRIVGVVSEGHIEGRLERPVG